MIIGKIDYINLLPFYLFLKKRLRRSYERAALEHKKGVPAEVNEAFRRRRIEAAVISSVHSHKYPCADFGIVAKKEVLSVLVCEGEAKGDAESGTSNILARILGVQGEVVIGDKALREQRRCKDLAALWHKKTGLPFVFARFCFRARPKAYRRLAKEFLATRQKIPRYILRHYAQRSGLAPDEILRYLGHIHYPIGYKEKQGLRRFLRMMRRHKRA